MAVFTVTLACRRTSAFIFKDVDAEVERIKEAMGAEVDITFDCAGFNKTMSTAFGATSSGGKVCLVGMGHSEMTLPLAPAAVRQFICIGRFTAVSFQVLGHMKTILVLILRFLFFKKEGLNLQVVIGMVIAVIGMVWYGNASSKPGGKERRSYSIPRSSQQKHGGLSESSEVDEKFFHQDPCTYSTENIDKIRDLWAKYVLELEQDDANEDGMNIA